MRETPCVTGLSFILGWPRNGGFLSPRMTCVLRHKSRWPRTNAFFVCLFPEVFFLSFSAN